MVRATRALALVAGCLLLSRTPAFGQETEISVTKGKVKVQSTSGSITIVAGQKGVLRRGQKPIATVDEPMVHDLIRMRPWAEAERRAKRERIDFTSIQIRRIEDEKRPTSASLSQHTNQ